MPPHKIDVNLRCPIPILREAINRMKLTDDGEILLTSMMLANLQAGKLELEVEELEGMSPKDPAQSRFISVYNKLCAHGYMKIELGKKPGILTAKYL